MSVTRSDWCNLCQSASCAHAHEFGMVRYERDVAFERNNRLSIALRALLDQVASAAPLSWAASPPERAINEAAIWEKRTVEIMANAWIALGEP